MCGCVAWEGVVTMGPPTEEKVERRGVHPEKTKKELNMCICMLFSHCKFCKSIFGHALGVNP